MNLRTASASLIGSGAALIAATDDDGTVAAEPPTASNVQLAARLRLCETVLHASSEFFRCAACAERVIVVESDEADDERVSESRRPLLLPDATFALFFESAGLTARLDAKSREPLRLRR